MTRCCDIDPIVFGHICEQGRPQRPRFEPEPPEPADGDQLAQLNHEIRIHQMTHQETTTDRFNRMFGRLIR